VRFLKADSASQLQNVELGLRRVHVRQVLTYDRFLVCRNWTAQVEEEYSELELVHASETRLSIE
jgi:hypothetical protein